MVLDDVEKIAEAGYDLIIIHSSESGGKEIDNAKSLFEKEWMASLSLNNKNLDYFKPFENSGIPLIFFDRVVQDENNSVIIIDNHKCGYIATKHIIELGFNNDIISKLIERLLSTVNYPGSDVGEVAARSLLNHLNEISDIPLTNTILLRSDLIIRKSSLKKEKYACLS